MSGPVALVGSGEFLEAMRAVDEELLAGRPRRAVFLPTAAAQEGDERISYWLDLGIGHYQAMGVEPIPVPVLSRRDAEDEELASIIATADAGLVYLSGGDPGYLADTLRDTAVWQAIHAAWEAGAALAGCSAGACALSAVANHVRDRSAGLSAGLGVVPQLVVIPHFDRIERWAPGIVESALEQAPSGTTVIGVDEETALVGGPTSFVVRGRQAAWRLDRDGNRLRFAAGEEVEIPPALDG